MAGPFTAPVALSVPMLNRDDRDNDFKALDVQTGLEEIDFRRETKEPTGFVNRYLSAMTFNDGTRTLTLTPLAGSYKYFIWGEEFVISSVKNHIIPDTEGLHFIWFDADGELDSNQTYTYFDFLAQKAYVAVIYWDATNKEAVFTLEERHGMIMPNATHMNMHYSQGSRVGIGEFKPYNYLTGEDGSLNSHAEIAFTDGVFFDEDIGVVITDTPTPTLQGQQTLSPQARIPIYYLDGTEAAPLIRRDGVSNAPLYLDTGNTPLINKLVAGNWTLSNTTEGYYIAQVICVTGDLNEPVICLNATEEFQSAAEAALNIDTVTRLGEFLRSELVPVEFLVYECKSTFGNDYKARLMQVISAGELRSIKDRYAITVSYAGNANTGRLLVFAGAVDDSEDQPLLVPEDSYIRTITLQATADMPIGREIGFYSLTDLVNPLFTITMPVVGDHYVFYVSEFIAEDTEIVVKVDTGAISKPVVRFWLETINI